MKTILIVGLLAFIGSNEAMKLMAANPKEACDFTPGTGNCQPPNCFCSSAMEHPNAQNLNIADVPQFVYLTFDGGINVLDYPIYEEIFDGTRQNPNGANISATFFIQHEYTSYTKTHQLYRQGHEIALGSITHNYDANYWKQLDEAGWKAEIGDQREQMAHLAKIPIDQIVGFRAPLLQGGGDLMYSAAIGAGLKYESSRPTVKFTPYLWPYTADYDSIQDCPTEPCYNSSFPGFWVSPLVDLVGNDSTECATVDACLEAPETEQDAYDLLMKNFNLHFNSNRSPYGVYANAAWLLNAEKPFIKSAYIRFVEDILQNPAVYIVSINKALNWMQNPQPLDNIDAVEGFPPTPMPADGCRVMLECVYTGDQLPAGMFGERRMSSCVLCPPKYPWKDNPMGSN